MEMSDESIGNAEVSYILISFILILKDLFYYLTVKCNRIH